MAASRICAAIYDPDESSLRGRVCVWPEDYAHESVEGRARKVSRFVKSPEQCDVFIPNHHQGYIAWKEFQENLVRIRDNAAMHGRRESTGTGAATSGEGLLSGSRVAAGADTP